MTTVMQRTSAHHHGGTLSSFAPFESRAMNSVSLVSVCKGTGLVEQKCNTGPSSAMTLLFPFCSLFVHCIRHGTKSARHYSIDYPIQGRCGWSRPSRARAAILTVTTHRPLMTLLASLAPSNERLVPAKHADSPLFDKQSKNKGSDSSLPSLWDLVHHYLLLPSLSQHTPNHNITPHPSPLRCFPVNTSLAIPPNLSQSLPR